MQVVSCETRLSGFWGSLKQNPAFSRCLSSTAETILSSLQNFEQSGIPDGASSAYSSTGFDLACMEQILGDLGNPQRELKVVHIAGTKGKGSISAMLSSILKQSGLKVGTYTSPHITSLRERIAVDLEPIPRQEFDSLAHQHAERLVARKLSHFEALTALALRHFREQQVDVAVIEVGLGGIRDATNVFDSRNLQLAVITAIGLEHQKALGSSLKEIAAAKVGICKFGRPVVVGPQPEAEALQTIKEEAAATGSPAVHASQEVAVVEGEVVRSEGSVHQRMQLAASTSSTCKQLLRQSLDVRMQMVGSHQADNAATAVAAASQLWNHGWPQISAESVARGLEAAVLPGRFQVTKLGEGKPWLVLDGAHTPASADALSRTLHRAFQGEPLALIVAMASDKDHAGVLSALRRARPAVVVFTTVPIAGANNRSAPPGMLAAHWQAGGFSEDKPLRSRELLKANMATALDACQRELFSAKGDGVICVTGSLHAVGSAASIG